MSQPEYKTLSDIPDDLLNHYLKQEVIAVDTELQGLRLYRDQVCLVQLCDDEDNVCIITPDIQNPPQNLKKLMEDVEVLKVFHFAQTDVAFLKVSLKINVNPFCCTRLMSKLVRTYTGSHGLKDISLEFLDVQMDKEQQQTDWSKPGLTSKQLKYAANDVLFLVKIYHCLLDMIKRRGDLSTGISLLELHHKSQSILPNLVDLLIHGYGDQDQGWQTTLFNH